jgi:hypothetical protein
VIRVEEFTANEAAVPPKQRVIRVSVKVCQGFSFDENGS